MSKTPSHYNQGNIEPIDVIEDWGLGFNLGNVIKYVARAEYKGSRIQDLKKASYYLNRELHNVQAQFKETGSEES